MNKQDIINEINRLTGELPLRQKIAEIAEHEGLELAVNELTENCCASVKSKSYKNSIQQIKDLKTISAFQDYLQSQKDRIDAIHNRIAQLKFDLTNEQLTLFAEALQNKRATGIYHNNAELFTGDIFETHEHNFIIVTESSENPDKYVIIQTDSDEELLLNSLKNRTLLNDTAYLGNLYENEKLQEILDKIRPPETEEDAAEEDDTDEEEN